MRSATGAATRLYNSAANGPSPRTIETERVPPGLCFRSTQWKKSSLSVPAPGYTAALYCARGNLSPLLFEGELSKDILPGGQLMTTTEVENYPGFPDGVTGPEMMALFKKQAERFGARIESKTISSVDFSNRPFTVVAGKESWRAKSIIIATGATARYLGLPSEETYMNRGVSACATCDGALPRFRNKPLVVVGGGDTAMEEALFLTNYTSKVHIVHRRDKFRASKIMADRAIANPKIVCEWNSTVDEVLGDAKLGVTGARIRDVNTAPRHIAYRHSPP